VTLSVRQAARAAASERLLCALVDIAARGLRTHCNDVGTGGLWLSESEAERAETAKLCAGCPVLLECWEVGKYQSFGMWAGVDRIRPAAKGRPAS
jgi:hypothetical protein